MIILDATNQSLEAVTSLAASVDYTASWVDITTTTFSPGSGAANIATAATTSIIPAPGAASTQRQVKFLTVCNRSTSQTVYLQKNIGGTLIRMTPDVVLAQGEVLQYLDGQGFSVLDPFARQKQASSATLVNTPGINSQWWVRDLDVTTVMQNVLTEMSLTNHLLNLAFNLDFNLDQLRGEFRATQ